MLYRKPLENDLFISRRLRYCKLQSYSHYRLLSLDIRSKSPLAQCHHQLCSDHHIAVPFLRGKTPRKIWIESWPRVRVPNSPLTMTDVMSNRLLRLQVRSRGSMIRTTAIEHLISRGRYRITQPSLAHSLQSTST